MTANTNTTRDRDTSNDHLGTSNTDSESRSGLRDLTSKQQAIIIAALEHPDDPAITIATRVGTAQSYPSQVVDTHGDLLNELRDDLAAGESVVDVIERELSNQEIAKLVEGGLLSEVDTRLTEYTSYTESDCDGSTADQRSTGVRRGVPVDRPVSSQRSFMNAVPHDDDNRESGTNQRNLRSDRYDAESGPSQAGQIKTEVGTETDPTNEEHCTESSVPSSSIDSEDELWQWYDALTQKQRTIVDTILQNPDETDTHIAEIVSKKLPSGESVSRAYVSIIQSEDADQLEALRKHRDGSRIESTSEDQYDLEREGKAAEHQQASGDTLDNQVGSGSSVAVDDLKRVRDRIAFSTSVIEHEYALWQNTVTGDDETAPSGTHVAGTVAFAKRTLAEIDELIESAETG